MGGGAMVMVGATTEDGVNDVEGRQSSGDTTGEDDLRQRVESMRSMVATGATTGDEVDEFEGRMRRRRCRRCWRFPARPRLIGLRSDRFVEDGRRAMVPRGSSPLCNNSGFFGIRDPKPLYQMLPDFRMKEEQASSVKITIEKSL
ncbi:uncharacterized protein A4U43_C01F22430 [Asparagus officinalis]|uniref:Uncharacterized protein n=1 Tax=Asparagus officinalis TaxID=4686 RepID=A0A5P1FRA7_ASPOF|nr:uncharacterized protein A4U43_C01F22430 [Asparagus officinalis]